MNPYDPDPSSYSISMTSINRDRSSYLAIKDVIKEIRLNRDQLYGAEGMQPIQEVIRTHDQTIRTEQIKLSLEYQPAVFSLDEVQVMREIAHKWDHLQKRVDDVVMMTKKGSRELELMMELLQDPESAARFGNTLESDCNAMIDKLDSVCLIGFGEGFRKHRDWMRQQQIRNKAAVCQWYAAALKHILHIRATNIPIELVQKAEHHIEGFLERVNESAVPPRLSDLTKVVKLVKDTPDPTEVVQLPTKLPDALYQKIACNWATNSLHTFYCACQIEDGELQAIYRQACDLFLYQIRNWERQFRRVVVTNPINAQAQFDEFSEKFGWFREECQRHEETYQKELIEEWKHHRDQFKYDRPYKIEPYKPQGCYPSTTSVAPQPQPPPSSSSPAPEASSTAGTQAHHQPPSMRRSPTPEGSTLKTPSSTPTSF